MAKEPACEDGEAMTTFAAGDTAIATKFIQRVDRKASIALGKSCTITEARQGSEPDVWIVGIRTERGGFMRDIVVQNEIPLRKA